MRQVSLYLKILPILSGFLGIRIPRLQLQRDEYFLEDFKRGVDEASHFTWTASTI